MKAVNRYEEFQAQIKRFTAYLREYTTSRYNASIDTGIPLQNVCRYVSMLQKQNSIAVVRLDRCPISGETVEFLTTNPELFPKECQLKLWE